MRKILTLMLSLCMIMTMVMPSAVIAVSADTAITMSELSYEIDGTSVPLPQAGNLKITSTATGTGKLTLIAALYNKETGKLENACTSEEVTLTGDSKTVSVAINVTNLSNQRLRVFAWDMNDLTPFEIPNNAITFKDAAELADYYAINTYGKSVRYKNLTCSPLAGKSYFDDNNYYMWQVCSYGNNNVKPHSVTFAPTNVTESVRKDYTIYILAAGTNSGDILQIHDADNTTAEPNSSIVLYNTWDLKDKSNNAPLVMKKVRIKDWDVSPTEILGLNKKTGNVAVREIYIFDSKNVSDELETVIMNSTMGKYEDEVKTDENTITFEEAAALADYSAVFTKSGIVGNMTNQNVAGSYFDTQYFAWEPAQYASYYNFTSDAITSDISGDYTIYILAGSYDVGDTSKNDGNGQLRVFDGKLNSIGSLSIPAKTIVLADHKTELIETGYNMYKLQASNYQMTKDSAIKFDSTTKHGTFIRKIYIFKTSNVTNDVDAAMMSGH